MDEKLKELLSKILGKEVKLYNFKHYINLNISQYKDKEVSDIDIESFEPAYNVELIDGTKTAVTFEEIFSYLYSKIN